MIKEKVKVIIIIMALCLATGTIYKAGRSDTRISREYRTDSERGGGIRFCESSGDGAGEGFTISKESKESVALNQTEEVNTTEEATDSESHWRVYDSLDELEEDVNLPYVDEEVFGIIKSTYEEVDFEGEFDKGNPDTYEEYREIFQRLIRNEVTYLDADTGEEDYLKNSALFKYLSSLTEAESFEYIFFDIDGDGRQELCIREQYCNVSSEFFKYDPQKQKIISWCPGSGGSWGAWEALIGTGKVQNNPLMKYFCFYQYDESGNEVCNTCLSFEAIDTENTIYLVTMPAFADREGEEVPEEIKSQGAFARHSEEWYFRITEEQYEELLQPHMDAYETAREKIKEVTYTYEEFLSVSSEKILR